MQFLKKITLASWVAIVDAITLLIGLGLYILDYSELQSTLFAGALIILALPLWFEIVKDIYNKKLGVDIIAGLAIIGAWWMGETLAGLVVVLMLSGGQALESFAMRKAQYELTRLLARAPQTALKKEGENFVSVSIDTIIPGDEIMIKSGEIIPVDGIVYSGSSYIDESTITGEAIPVQKTVGALVVSGTENTTSVLIIKAQKNAAESRYAKIVDLVKSAQESRAPLVRIADQYAVFFTGVTLFLGVLAYVIFRDPVRVLAVLVVATPCPLILATPIAIISGMSRAAKQGVIIKQGGALEVLARVKTMLFDKTGTITVGTPTVVSVKRFSTDVNIAQIAAALDHGSSHILARSLELYATTNNIELLAVEHFKESFGEGVEGKVSGIYYVLGKYEYIINLGKKVSHDVDLFRDLEKENGNMVVYLGTETKIIGAISFADTVRPDIANMFQVLNERGVTTAMLTGDHKSVAEKIARAVGISKVQADCAPEDKVWFVEEAVKTNGPVAMIGDGVNDAPALARADVGIAIAHHGDTASSDSAGIVVLHGSLGRVIETYQIAQKTISIAKQGIWLGIGLSVIAMIAAVFGLVQPLAGALLQEGIDVVVILGALRVLVVKIT